jgi:HAD superfamily hydrolase (TIGR01509 family)
MTLARGGRNLDAAVLPALAGASVDFAAAVLRVAANQLRVSLQESFAAHQLVPLPGAREVVEMLSARSRLAVATNAPSDVVSVALDRVDLLHKFDLIVSAESQPRAKPAPDVYEAVCQLLNTAPRHAVAFEDSPIGVRAARSAGLTVVYVTSDGRPADADLKVVTLDDPRLLDFLSTN